VEITAGGPPTKVEEEREAAREEAELIKAFEASSD